MITSASFFVFTFCACVGVQLPDEIKICHRADPQRDDCLKDSAQATIKLLQKGLPGFNTGTIDPITIPSLVIGEGTGVVHVEQNYKNVEIHNLGTMVVEKFESHVDDEKVQFLLDTFCKDYFWEAEYSVHGRILMLPISGNGTCTYHLKNVKIKFDMQGEVIERNGKQYLEIKENKVLLRPEEVRFEFRNLFNGDEQLGNEMNKLLNENWKEVFYDVVHAYEEAVGAVFKLYINKIFNKIPYDEIFPL
ncbi:hypothetical protein FQA39_LY16861 [Lamprigera yunnana]|nr:hypothetical protein FQA39_LY16861 [Lamprigera yunnana]